VILSAYRDLADAQRGLADRVLAKPVDVGKLLGAVHELAAA